MQRAVVPPGILMFLFISPLLVVQATLKPVNLSQTHFHEPEGLLYLQRASPPKEKACGRPGSSRILGTQIHWSLVPLLKSKGLGLYSELVIGLPLLFLLPPVRV